MLFHYSKFGLCWHWEAHEQQHSVWFSDMITEFGILALYLVGRKEIFKINIIVMFAVGFLFYKRDGHCLAFDLSMIQIFPSAPSGGKKVEASANLTTIKTSCNNSNPFTFHWECKFGVNDSDFNDFQLCTCVCICVPVCVYVCILFIEVDFESVNAQHHSYQQLQSLFPHQAQ